jgi:hypothetical protein
MPFKQETNMGITDREIEKLETQAYILDKIWEKREMIAAHDRLKSVLVEDIVYLQLMVDEL